MSAAVKLLAVEQGSSLASVMMSMAHLTDLDKLTLHYLCNEDIDGVSKSPGMYAVDITKVSCEMMLVHYFSLNLMEIIADARKLGVRLIEFHVNGHENPKYKCFS